MLTEELDTEKCDLLKKLVIVQRVEDRGVDLLMEELDAEKRDLLKKLDTVPHKHDNINNTRKLKYPDDDSPGDGDMKPASRP